MGTLDQDSIIGVIGAGTMGSGIAQVAAQAGHRVKLYDADAEAVSQGIERVRAQLDKRVEKGKTEAADRDAVIERLQPAHALSDFSDAALIIEAIVEDLKVKQTVLSEVEAASSGRAILATNTSSLSITAIAAGLSYPERLVGLHFFNPAPVLKLVEVIHGLATDKALVDIAYETMTAWGKVPVRARNTPGFIVNRVARPFYAESFNLLEQRATDAVTVDALMRECGGFRMGPCQLTDLIGQDVNAKVTETVFRAFHGDPRFRPSLVQQELVDAGLLGRKSGRGFYDYRDGAGQSEPATTPSAPAPESVVVEGGLDGGLLAPLADRLEAAGVQVERTDGEARIRMAGATLALSDGRLATQRSADESDPDLILFDLSWDYSQASRIGLSASDGASETARSAAAGVFQAAGMAVSWLDDAPGLAVLRTVAMLANEGAAAVLDGICDAGGADDATLYGLNYPRGPLAWADQVGPSFVIRVLRNLQDCFGDDRYRPSPLLQRVAATQSHFHDHR